MVIVFLGKAWDFMKRLIDLPIRTFFDDKKVAFVSIDLFGDDM